MGLRESIRQASRTALFAMADMAEQVQYFEVDASGYSVVTGRAERTTKQSHSIQAWFSSYTERETDGSNVQPGDKRLTIMATDVTFPVAMHDYIIDSKGVQWEVINYKIPLTEAVFILQVRKP